MKIGFCRRCGLEVVGSGLSRVRGGGRRGMVMVVVGGSQGVSDGGGLSW